MRTLLGLGMLLLASLAPAHGFAAIELIRTYDGASAGDAFGEACYVIGDMDGDGLAEFAIGAPGDDTGGDDAGRVFVFRGAATLGDDPAWILTGAPGERLGHALGAAFVDGDSWPDLVIGAPGSTGAPATLTGKVVIAFGGSPLGSRATATVAGTAPAGRFGWAVAGLTLFGYSPSGPARVLVGAPGANTGAGEVHGIGAGDPPPATRLFVLHGVEPGEAFGWSVADAGVTRGFIVGQEFLIGAPENGAGGASAGRSALFFWDTPPDTTAVDEDFGATGDRRGHSVTAGHDINPNYFEPSDDWVVGAPGASPGGVGGAGVASVQVDWPEFDLEGSGAQAGLGSCVRLLDDATGTWLPDLAVAQSGVVRIYPGPLSPSSDPVAMLLAESEGDAFGRSISNSGRIRMTSNYRNQFLIGAPDHEGQGRMYVYGDPTDPTDAGPWPTVTALRLAPPAPNPSRDVVGFTVELPRAARARVRVVDVSGREVARLHEGPLGPGRAALEWRPDASCAPGLYWCVAEVDGERVSRGVVRLR